MKMIHKIIALCLLLGPLQLSAQEAGATASMQTDWMELVKGYRDESTGAEVRDIGEGDVAGTRKIVVSIPKSALDSPDEIEEVVVVGQRPEKWKMPDLLEGMQEGLEDIEYEWLDDYDNDNYGLVIKLSKDTKWPIRLFMYSETGYID